MAKTANAKSLFEDLKKEKTINLKEQNKDVNISVEVEKASTSIGGSTLKNDVNKALEYTSTEGMIYQLAPSSFIPYRDEKLRLDLHEGYAYERLKESIIQNGIVEPIIAMRTEKDDVYEIVAGHNRVNICKELNLKVPCIIKDSLSIEEANKICIDTNLLNRQRSEFKPSQFAYMLKVRFEKEKHQGVSTNEEYAGTKIGAQFSLDRRTIHRYIKLNQLTEKAKEVLDAGTITLRLAYELAFLPEIVQDFIIDNLNNYKINEGVVKQLKEQLKQQPIDDATELLKYVKFFLPQKVKTSRKFDYRNVREFIPPTIADDQIEEYIINALKYYAHINQN